MKPRLLQLLVGSLLAALAAGGCSRAEPPPPQTFEGAEQESAGSNEAAEAEAKIADIEERITQLDAMKRALGELVVQCRGEGPLSDCPILDALDEEAP